MICRGGNFSSSAVGVSADGAVIVGSGTTSSGREVFRWTESGGMVGLGYLPGTVESTGGHVSADGATLVGFSGSNFGDPANITGEAFRWTQSGGMVALGDLPGASFYSEALDISADGSIVVGVSDAATGWPSAYRWTQAGGMVALGDLAGGVFSSSAFGISADGGTIVGQSTSALGPEAVRWTQSGGIQGLGDLPGGAFTSRAEAVSADGSVIGGFGTSVAGTEDAMLWTEAAGMQSVQDVLVTQGLGEPCPI